MAKLSSQSAASPAGASSSPMSTNLLKRKHMMSRGEQLVASTEMEVSEHAVCSNDMFKFVQVILSHYRLLLTTAMASVL